MTQKHVVKTRWVSQFLFGLSLLFLGFGLFNLGWVVWPAPSDAVQFTIPSGILPGTPAGTTYASLADYALTVSWPVWLRKGETGQIHVKLTEIDDGKSLPEPEQKAQVLLVEPSLITLLIEPHGTMQTNLAPGQDLDMVWAVTGTTEGEFPGKVVVSFGFYDAALADLVPVPVAIVDMTVHVTALWGLGSNLVMWFGVVSLILWGMLFLLGRVAQVQ